MRAFQANQARKDRFLIFWMEKNKFQTRNVKFKKVPKYQIFQLKIYKAPFPRKYDQKRVTTRKC